MPPTPSEPPKAPTVANVATCPLTMRLEAKPLSDGKYTLTVFAESNIEYAQQVEVPDRCPRGFIDFDGLGAG
jgi:hypothetical protein